MPDHPVLRVSGAATREVPPDLATFVVTLVARNGDRRRAVAALADRQHRLRSLLDGFDDAIERCEPGVVVTAELGRRGDRVSGYAATVLVQVAVCDCSRIGELLSLAVDIDGCTVAGPTWSLRADCPAVREVRQEAVAATIRRAGEYAEALGSRLLSLLELRDGDGGPDTTAVAPVRLAKLSSAAGPQLDLDPELLTVSVRLDGVFEISPPAAVTA